ncbi:MAG: acylphosphatase [Acidimicrobiia bacterium]|nr:acylphosphatase [Acidimicrobiia bacterium]MBT8193192.1 acylphosphatase [Acidimicrobiia bacterium]MBT8248093.1 acylphosphatase [Acidimicrobiia bacterium]NNF89661.1 acylphosphatase [Acidimicrobiia bacterium]NNJ46990.1 acylphosphatase [Acidimicrobiia bacterium]
MSDVRATRCQISGRVQGVGFRYTARERGTDLGLSGWVRNISGGRVEVFAQGPAPLVEVFLTWLHDGPTAARVDRVDEVPAVPDPRFTVFEVRA